MSRAWPVPDIKPKASAARNAGRILAVRLDELFSYAAAIPDPEAVAELHNARIAAKRLRYTLELFPVIFGEAGAEAIAQLRVVQDDLGRIHDLDVRLDLIDAEIESLGEATSTVETEARVGLEALRERQYAARSRQHRTFVTRWQAFEQSSFRASLANAT